MKSQTSPSLLPLNGKELPGDAVANPRVSGMRTTVGPLGAIRRGGHNAFIAQVPASGGYF